MAVSLKQERRHAARVRRGACVGTVMGVLTALVVSACLAIPTRADETPVATTPAKALRVGMATNYPPLVFDRNGELTGIEVERPADLSQYIGIEIGVSDWFTVDQIIIDKFAEATGDHQWIHVDVERARATPFGGTIAHGYLTLSLVNYFLPQLMRAEGMKFGLNYGCDRVRFPDALRTGSRVRARLEIIGVEDVGEGGVQVKMRVTLEAEGGVKPVCVADTLSRLYF